MEYAKFYIWASVITFLYTITCIIFYIRSKNSLIARRSPLLVIYSQIGGWLQTMVMISLIVLNSDSFYLQASKHQDFILRLRQSALILGHQLLFVPYLLRGYRLYFLFHLEQNLDHQDDFFTKHKHRVNQKWLIKVLMAFCVPALALIVLILCDAAAASYIPCTEVETNQTALEISRCIFTFYCFLEQISLLLSSYWLRNIQDDYQVSSELIFVGFLWVITPLFPVIKQSNTWLLIPVIIRNTLLLLRSCLYPLIRSYYIKYSHEIITCEMVNSLKLVLQSEFLLTNFEHFLQNDSTNINHCQESSFQGAKLLDLYMKCEYFLAFEDPLLHKELLEGFEQFLPKPPDDINEKTVKAAKNVLFDIINRLIFPRFLKSAHCETLKNQIMRQEIYLGRILQTSLDCTFYIGTIAHRRSSGYRLAKVL